MVGVTRPADHPFATRRCLSIELVAHRQFRTSEYPTTLRASDFMGWPLWTLLEGCHRSNRSSEPHRLIAIVFFAATVLPRYRRPRLWRGRHIFDARCILLTRSRCRRALRGRRAAANFGSSERVRMAEPCFV
eukprot:2039746-Prymnesium_polylepis.1